MLILFQFNYHYFRSTPEWRTTVLLVPPGVCCIYAHVFSVFRSAPGWRIAVLLVPPCVVRCVHHLPVPVRRLHLHDCLFSRHSGSQQVIGLEEHFVGVSVIEFAVNLYSELLTINQASWEHLFHVSNIWMVCLASICWTVSLKFFLFKYVNKMHIDFRCYKVFLTSRSHR